MSPRTSRSVAPPPVPDTSTTGRDGSTLTKAEFAAHLSEFVGGLKLANPDRIADPRNLGRAQVIAPRDDSPNHHAVAISLPKGGWTLNVDFLPNGKVTAKLGGSNRRELDKGETELLKEALITQVEVMSNNRPTLKQFEFQAQALSRDDRQPVAEMAKEMLVWHQRGVQDLRYLVENRFSPRTGWLGK